MSIFEESVWESNETGDKLTKELFVGKKKAKSVKKTLVNIKESGEKSITHGKLKSQILRTEVNGEGSDGSAPRNKSINKKRKASSIEIDEAMIKKWKAESISRGLDSRGAKSWQNESDKKPTKLKDQSTANLEKKTVGNGALGTKLASKKKNSESKVKPDRLDGKKKKLNGTHSETDSKSDSNLMTKSQKRRLKNKEKLLNSQKSLTSDETNKDGEKHSLNANDLSGGIGNGTNSSDVKVSNKMNKSKLKIDRLKRLLVDKEQGSSKNGGNSTEPKSLRDRMMARLKSSRFRYLNEQMYSSESWSSKKYFNEDPDAFVAYHEGYKLQVDQWPLNPLDAVIASVKRLPKDYVIADFGCGEARLADSVTQKVHSLDLVAINDRVTACDMAHTSLLTGRIDVVVFCLSLMGTNLTDYLIEANRVLRKDGILKIAEVESRFEDADEFVKILASYGFVNTWKDLTHNLFYFMDFKKEGDITKKRNKLPPLALKSCLYKRR